MLESKSSALYRLATPLYNIIGDLDGIRTHSTALKGRRLNLLDYEAIIELLMN